MDKVVTSSQLRDSVLVITERGVIYEVRRDDFTGGITIRVLANLPDLV